MRSAMFSIRVLGLHENGEWCAIALDMSLRGYGDTFEQALDDLRDAVEAQVSFALQHNRLDRIWVPVDPHYVELYQNARQRAMRDYLRASEDGIAVERDYAASDIPLPRAGGGAFEATV